RGPGGRRRARGRRLAAEPDPGAGADPARRGPALRSHRERDVTWTFDLEHPLGPALTVRRHRLENGLTLLSVVDREAPIVTYQTWYRVGSRDEEVGRTGMAHLF